MNKDQRSLVVEYISNLSEEDLRGITAQLTDKFAGDLGEALNTMSKSDRVDYLLSEAEGANDLFDLCDQIREVAAKECKRRNAAARQ